MPDNYSNIYGRYRRAAGLTQERAAELRRRALRMWPDVEKNCIRGRWNWRRGSGTMIKDNMEGKEYDESERTGDSNC